MPRVNQTRKFDIHRANLNQFSRKNRPIINPIPIHQLIHPGKYGNCFHFFHKRNSIFFRIGNYRFYGVGLLISNDLFSNGKQ